MFHVGQKVVCVSKFTSENVYRDIWPLQGRVYTVRGIMPAFEFDGEGLWLEEIVNKPHLFRTDAGTCVVEANFWGDRFRPVVTTDISIFEAMLVPTPKEKAEA